MADPKQVLVVGAGPVGLMMAAELHRHGVPCRLVERMLEPSPHCRALGVTPRTLEAFDDLGIVDRALASGMGLLGLVSMANGDVGTAQVSGDALPDGAYGFLTLAQYDVEAILTEHLASLGAVSSAAASWSGSARPTPWSRPRSSMPTARARPSSPPG